MLATDVHSHLVPGVDEGSRDLAESLIMARGLERLGVKRLHLTPHEMRFGPALGAQRVRSLVGEAGDAFARAGVGLEIVAGAEYYFGERLLDAVQAGADLVTWPSHGSSGPGPSVLIELPLREPVVGVGRLGRLLVQRGIRPVMAHPERVVALQFDAQRLTRWRSEGWRFQLDLLSLVGAYGLEARDVATRLLQVGAYDVVGSDLHRASQLDDLARAHDAWRRLAPPVPRVG